MWVLLMEKAYAKVFGSYDKIEAGISGQAIRDLTGAPMEFIVNKNADEAWSFIKENDEKKFILTAGS